MIGKAIHRILKDKISNLNNGGVFPVIMPQNSKYSISSAKNYPAVIYHSFIDYETSKDKNANIIFCRVMIQTISNSYKEVDDISNKIRIVLDHYIDNSTDGLANVPGYTDSNGYPHSFVENINIQHIFYRDEEDDYYDKLKLFSRMVEYEVYYYDDIIQLSYDQKSSNNKTPTNPLIFSLDFTERGLMNFQSVTNNVIKVYNRLGRTTAVEQEGTTINTRIMSEFVEQSSGLPSFMPSYNDGTSDNTKAFVEFSGTKTLNFQIFNDANEKLHLPYGCMIILVYKPTGTGGENLLLGSAAQITDKSPLIISHKKVGSDITLHFNPNGTGFTGSARERTLITSTNSTNFWDADYHFFCLSLGGSKDYTGGSKNQEGWFEYFNSNYNPNLTTGQIIKNNTINGNTDDMGYNDDQFFINRTGDLISSSSGFRMYEMMIFIPNEKKTHNINADAAPFQSTDIIYKKAKDYIFKKYPTLK